MPRRLAPELACLLLAGALSLLVACIYFRCFSPGVLEQPWYAFNDVPLMQTWCKVAAEGEALPWQPRMVSRLNAPFSANWADFPTPEELLWDGCALLFLWLGVVPGYNLALLLAHGLAGCSFYLAARVLGSARAPAIFGAVAFASARYLFVRDAVHINLSYCWHVPWLWVTTNWFWQRRSLSKKAWLGLVGLCAVTAWQNPYYWFFWLVMLVPCWLVPLIQKQWRPTLAPLAVTLLSAFFVFLGQIDSLLGWIRFGKGHPYVRSLNELMVYGLRLPEFFLPEGHHWVAFDEWSHLNYYMPMTPGHAEMDSSYLGFIGMAVLVYLTVLGLGRVLRRQPVPFAFGMSCWLLITMLPGGLTMLAGSVGFLLFRCTNRCSIVLQVGLLLFLALRLTRWRTFAGPRAWLILPLLAFNAWDCMPPYIEDRDTVAAYLANQRATVAYLEGALPSKAMVFQWPQIDYPEYHRVRDLWPYEQLIGYLLSKDLRFSHGNCANRPEATWQTELVGKDPQSICSELESYGFSALWLYTNGQDDQERERWRHWQKQPDFRSPLGDLWVYRLKPSARPQLPRMKPCRTLSPAFLGPEKDERLGMNWRWVWGPARIDLLLPSPCPYRLRFGLSAAGSPRNIQLRLDGKPYGQVQAPARWGVYREVDIDLSRLKSGDHRLELIPSGSALPPLLKDNRRLTFQYINERFDSL
ncbi:hypothetical protein JST97_31460 [bacterium]|nr:hypothetical protein [bacterium]